MTFLIIFLIAVCRLPLIVGIVAWLIYRQWHLKLRRMELYTCVVLIVMLMTIGQIHTSLSMWRVWHG